jgi:hypothetical protein
MENDSPVRIASRLLYRQVDGNASENYLAGRLDAIAAIPKCTAKSRLCNGACVPKKRKCREQISHSQLQRIVHKEEDLIKDLPYERAIAIDPATGQVLFNKGGQQTSVYFTSDEVAKMKGAIMTHNHPNVGAWMPPDERAKGFSFSKADMHCASYCEVKEMRAVTSHYRHSIESPKSGWNQKYWEKTFKPTYEKHEKAVNREFIKGMFSGRTHYDYVEANFHHEVIKRTAQELGMKYTRTNV